MIFTSATVKGYFHASSQCNLTAITFGNRQQHLNLPAHRRNVPNKDIYVPVSSGRSRYLSLLDHSNNWWSLTIARQQYWLKRLISNHRLKESKLIIMVFSSMKLLFNLHGSTEKFAGQKTYCSRVILIYNNLFYRDMIFQWCL